MNGRALSATRPRNDIMAQCVPDCAADAMRPRLVLPPFCREQIIQEAQAGTPEEICGIVRGRNGIAKELVPSVNVAAERTIHYEVAPQVLMLQFRFEEAGDELTAIYHSHPASPAFPSATDAWNAQYPDAFYVICSLARPEPDIRAYRLQDAPFDCDLDALRQAVRFDETRPHLFAYFHPRATPLPPGIRGPSAGHPFYAVFHQPAPAAVPEVRCVQVAECAIADA